jgi:prepilin-type N-terminal cleavage/methylation domain-containing protein
MKTRTQQGFTLIELLVVITIIALLASLAMPVYGTVTEKGNITKTINNAKQIFLALKVYASDNDGRYPDSAKDDTGKSIDAKDSNTVFRQLFIANILADERIFNSPASPFIADGNIGTAPSFDKALDKGENHWAMMGGLNDSASPGSPVVFENAKTSDADPAWDTKSVGKSTKGRVWSGPSIVVGLNDGSVQKIKLTTDGKAKKNGDTNIFTANASADPSASSSVLPPTDP